jgi:hypothetical protein
VPRRESFGDQPFLKVIKERGHSYVWVTRQTGLHYTHFINVGQGRVPPSPEFRERLSKFLGLPQKRLFTAKALAAKYRPQRNSHVLTRRGDFVRGDYV